MIELPKDAPGEAACGYSGRPLVAHCACGRRRLVPFRKLGTAHGDRTPLHGRPFRCRACGASDVTLFALESQAELDAVRPELLPPEVPSGEIRRLNLPARAPVEFL